MKAKKTGKCWCGCGEPTKSFFKPGCDRRVQEVLLEMAYGRGTNAERLAGLGFGPDKSIIEKSD